MPLDTFVLVLPLKNSSGALYTAVPTTWTPNELWDTHNVSMSSLCCSDRPKSHILYVADDKSVNIKSEERIVPRLMKVMVSNIAYNNQ